MLPSLLLTGLCKILGPGYPPPSIRGAEHHWFVSLTDAYGRNFNLKPKDYLL